MNTEENRKELNLCELLYTHIGEKFYFPLLGYLPLININSAGQLVFELKPGTNIYVLSNGRDAFDQPAVFPSEAIKSWEEFLYDKTWSQFVKHTDIFKAPFDVCIDITGSSINGGWTRRNTPLEKSCLALIKINMLIDKWYGGHVTPEEWSNDMIDKYFITPLSLW